MENGANIPVCFVVAKWDMERCHFALQVSKKLATEPQSRYKGPIYLLVWKEAWLHQLVEAWATKPRFHAQVRHHCVQETNTFPGPWKLCRNAKPKVIVEDIFSITEKGSKVPQGRLKGPQGHAPILQRPHILFISLKTARWERDGRRHGGSIRCLLGSVFGSCFALERAHGRWKSPYKLGRKSKIARMGRRYR